ncbi:MAG: S41 family peptidase [bacterium]
MIDDVINVAPPRPRRVATLLALLLIFSVGLFIGRYLLPAGEFKYSALQFVTAEDGERQLVFPTFWEAWDKLHANFINELVDEDLYYGSVAGMVKAAGDPYTVFAPPPETRQFEENISGSFFGVGIEIGIRGDAVTVIAPLSGSPAEVAGILKEDIIVAVDKDSITPDTSIDEVVQKIRGPQGEPVVLTVLHKGASKTEDITVIRDNIKIESVKASIENDIAYIAITNFNEDTANRFDQVARQAASAKVRGIIIDVRGNPGGFLNTAVDITSRFLPKEAVVVTEQGKENKEYKAKGNALLQGIPTVVLVDGGSASASEILAGALQDTLSIPIIGTQTFGKGSVQEFMKLSDNSSMRVTVAKWYTPNGRSISDEGITPTIVVEQDRETKEDEQLLRAREELAKLIN